MNLKRGGRGNDKNAQYLSLYLTVILILTKKGEKGSLHIYEKWTIGILIVPYRKFEISISKF